ncbi:hypothetical protein SteCoe_11791 [Stentor coeruleus]|uniref:FCP1 homology domain-containing protein n=1 Tax=Stentor coeruleus TaxID=5963 RepID=A0A1R2CCD5_9CILI|nr:hypothetical protein SteCoe_11791 [Stentor coeruleus]
MSVDLTSNSTFLFPFPNNSNQNHIKLSSRVLPAVTRSSHKRTLVLDLDETLVHSSQQPIENPDNIVTLSNGTNTRTFFVKYRPGLMEFLRKVLKVFELVIYTASTKEYAEQVINKLDPQRKILKYRLYRDDCIQIGGHFVKDLSRLGRDLSQVVILDNSITSFAHHLDNGILILSWFDDPSDNELWKVANLLEQLINTQDVRPILNSIFNLPKIIQEYQQKYLDSN